MGRYPRYLPFVPLTVAPPDCRILPVRTVIGHRIAADGAVGIRSAELVPRPVVGLSVAVFIGHHPHHARFGTPGELVAGYREIVPAIPTRRLDAVVEPDHDITAESAERNHAPQGSIDGVQPPVGILQCSLRARLVSVEPDHRIVDELSRSGNIGDYPVAVRRTAFMGWPRPVSFGHYHAGTVASEQHSSQQHPICATYLFHSHLKQKSVGIIPTRSVSNPRPSAEKR